MKEAQGLKIGRWFFLLLSVLSSIASCVPFLFGCFPCQSLPSFSGLNPMATEIDYVGLDAFVTMLYLFTSHDDGGAMEKEIDLRLGRNSV